MSSFVMKEKVWISQKKNWIWILNDMLTALNAWYRSDKLIGQRRGVYVSLENNNDEKRFMKKMSPCQF